MTQAETDSDTREADSDTGEAGSPVLLRPHHLLCLLTYAGHGYSERFTARFDHIVARLAAGTPIRLVDGPDDVCAPLLDDPDAHCHSASVLQRDQRAAADLQALLGQPLAAGTTLQLDGPAWQGLRQAFADGRTRMACQGCEWHTLCSGIAGDVFVAARLQAGNRA